MDEKKGSHDEIRSPVSQPDITPSAGENKTDTEPGSEIDAEQDKEDTHYLTGFKLIGVVSSLTLVLFLLLLDMSILSTAIPQITSDFHSLPDVGWYVSAYQLASASFQPLTGKFYTYFRAKWTYLVFLCLFEVGSLICGLARSSPMLIAGRAVAGLGASGLMNGGVTVVAGTTPLEKRPLYTGIMLGIGQIGVITGPLIGGALTQYTTWRWCFYINLPLGGLAILLLLLVEIPDLTAKKPFSFGLIRSLLPELDLIGFAFFAPASVMFLLALQFGGGEEYPWNSATVIGLFCGVGVTAIIFAAWEARMGDRAMIPWSILRRRMVWASCGQACTLMSCVLVASNYMPIYFQAVKGVGPTRSGVSMLPSILSQLTMAIVSGAAVSKLGYYLPWVVGGGVVNAIGNGLVSTFSPSTSTGKWVGYQLILGAGRGSGFQMAMISVQNALPPAQIPLSFALLIFCQNFGAAVAVVVATAIFSQSLVSDIAKYAPSVSPQAVLAAGSGASAVRALVPPGSPELEGVLLSYANSFDKVFYLLVAFACVSFLFSLGMGWKDVSKKPVAKPTEAVKTAKDDVSLFERTQVSEQQS